MCRMIKFLAAVAAVTLLLSGCKKTISTTIVDVREGPGPGVRVRDSQGPYARVRMNSVAIIDKSLEQWHGATSEKRSRIAVELTNSRRTPTGTLEVWAVLRNRTDYPLQIEGRTQFFDADEAPIEGPTAWQRVHLPPQGVATYKEFSTRVHDIAYYYIEIREGR